MSDPTGWRAPPLPRNAATGNRFVATHRHINTNHNRNKPPKHRNMPATVKRISVSAEARQAYEALFKDRDERDRTYAKHLAPDKRDR